MESRTRVLATLSALVAIGVVAAAVGTYRIAVLSGDLAGLLELDLPLERVVGSVRRLASQRTAALETATAGSNRDVDTRVAELSENLSNRIDALVSLLADTGEELPEFARLGRKLESLRLAEAAFRSAGKESDKTTLVARSRAVERAAVDLAGPSRSLTDRGAAQATTDERTSLALLTLLAISSLILGAVLARYALRIFSEVRTLRILVPVCSDCLSVRNDPPFWHLVDRYLEDRGHTKLAHGRCPACEAARSEPQQSA